MAYLIKQYSISTRKTPEAVRDSIARNVMMPGSMVGAGVFVGEIRGNSFEFTRRQKGRNAWRPIFKGSWAKSGDGTLIKVTVSPSVFVLTLTYALILVGGIGVAVVLISPNPGEKFKSVELIFALFFFTGLPWMAFYSELNTAWSVARSFLASSDEDVQNSRKIPV